MRKAMALFSLLFLIFSCANETIITDSEATNAAALKSREFKAMTESYKIYHQYKMIEVQRITDDAKTGKSSMEDYFAAKEAYIERLTELMKDVASKRASFKAKFPNAHEGMNAGEILAQLKASAHVE